MGPHTIKALRRFKSRYPIPAESMVLEIGSCDVNGTIRREFPESIYTGYDLVAGPNVNVVGDERIPLRSQLRMEYDLVLCCDVLEHCKAPWELVFQMRDVMKQNGLLFLLAPMAWPEHRHPIDCYRFLPDGLRYLVGRAGLVVLECHSFQSNIFPRLNQPKLWAHWLHAKWLNLWLKPKTGFAHTVCIARKP